MEIHQINLFRVRTALLEPWVTAYGSQTFIESLFVNLKADSTEGWGECSPAPLPLYNSEYTRGAFDVARYALCPQIVGKDIKSGQDLQSLLCSFKGHEFAKSAFDNAWWDLHAKSKQKPLWKLIGGTNQQVSVGADIPVLLDQKLLSNRIEAAVDQGFPRVKLKFNRRCTFDMLAAIREKFPDLVMHIDCNSGFTLQDLSLFQEIDQLNLAMIEQPLEYDDLIYHAKLQKRLKTPICLDESITSFQRAEKALEIGACGWINIKTSRVGGLTNALNIHDLCQERGIPVWIGGMLESSVGQGPSLALATKANISYPCDIFPSDRFFKEDCSKPDIILASGCKISAPSEIGHGFTPKLTTLHKTAKETFTIQ